MRIYVVNHDPHLRSLLQRTLQHDGHTVIVVASVGQADKRMRSQPPELIVLDVDKPDGSGIRDCNALRLSGVGCPILTLSVRRDVQSKIASLDAGADSVLGKPFAVAELSAHVRALLRRGQVAAAKPKAPAPQQVKAGRAALDFAARIARMGHDELTLTAREWRVLELLAQGRGRVVSRVEILEAVWGDHSAASSASLDVIVGRVRRKLGDDAIRTQRGEGYALG